MLFLHHSLPSSILAAALEIVDAKPLLKNLKQKEFRWPVLGDALGFSSRWVEAQFNLLETLAQIRSQHSKSVLIRLYISPDDKNSNQYIIKVRPGLHVFGLNQWREFGAGLPVCPNNKIKGRMKKYLAILRFFFSWIRPLCHYHPEKTTSPTQLRHKWYIRQPVYHYTLSQSALLISQHSQTFLSMPLCSTEKLF